MKRPGALLLFFSLVATALSGDTLAPVSVRKLDTVASGVAWIDSGRLAIAGRSGVRVLSLRDGSWSDLISTTPIPNGLPDPLSVVSDGQSVVASNGFARSEFACRVDNGKRIFARSSPFFMVIDIAVRQSNLYVLGWPVDAHGANNAGGVAVWRGPLSPHFEEFEPLHRIESGPKSVAIFNDSLPFYGGAMAIEPDGAVDVITAAEAGVFQYSSGGTFRRRLGAGLGELVIPRMHDINFTFSADVLRRYREIVNRQPIADDLVVTPDGPAIVVRIARNDSIEWELWYPNAQRVARRIKLGISRRGPFGHLACDAHGSDLACVYQAPENTQQAVAQDQSKGPSFLVQFKLPSSPAAGSAR